jgi:hypothetical protein
LDGTTDGLGRTENGMYHELGVRGTTASDIRAGSMYSTFYNKNDQTIDSGKVRGTDHFAVQSERLGER